MTTRSRTGELRRAKQKAVVPTAILRRLSSNSPAQPRNVSPSFDPCSRIHSSPSACRRSCLACSTSHGLRLRQALERTGSRLWALNGLTQSTSTEIRWGATDSVIDIRPRPALPVLVQSEMAPVPLSSPLNVLFIEGSSVSCGAHRVQWKLLMSAKIFSGGALPRRRAPFQSEWSQ